MEDKKRKGYEFALLAVLALLIILFFRFKPEEAAALWLLRGMLVLVIGALLKPEWFAPLFAGIMVITKAIGWVTNKILLSVVFFGILTPLGLLRKLLSKKAGAVESTWITRNKTFESKDLTKPF